MRCRLLQNRARARAHASFFPLRADSPSDPSPLSSLPLSLPLDKPATFLRVIRDTYIDRGARSSLSIEALGVTEKYRSHVSSMADHARSAVGRPRSLVCRLAGCCLPAPLVGERTCGCCVLHWKNSLDTGRRYRVSRSAVERDETVLFNIPIRALSRARRTMRFSVPRRGARERVNNAEKNNGAISEK